MSKPKFKIVLDIRRKKSNGLYPVKLSVFCLLDNKKQTKVYPILNTSNLLHLNEDKSISEKYPKIDEFSESQFNKIMNATNNTNSLMVQNRIFKKIVSNAEEISKTLEPFSFKEFEKLMFKKYSDGQDAFSYFDEIVEEKLKNGKVSTSEKYKLAKRSISKFLDYKELNPNKLILESVNKKFLDEYESYCTNIKKMSIATTAIYLRNLRTVYRLGIAAKEISGDNYPFGQGKYQIPSGGKVNKALTESDIRILWKAEPQNELQARAKDFWFFSYYAYGMNTRDICELKHSSINDKNIYYERAKTRYTKKNQTIKQVPLTKSMVEIIKRRKDKESKYLFGIITDTDTPTITHKKIQLFNNFINTHFRKFAIHAGINEILANEIGTYHARHSFATISVRKGNSFELISEILHDGNFKTTQSYLNSFPKETYNKLSQDLEIL